MPDNGIRPRRHDLLPFCHFNNSRSIAVLIQNKDEQHVLEKYADIGTNNESVREGRPSEPPVETRKQEADKQERSIDADKTPL
jgi:hypothetical protein